MAFHSDYEEIFFDRKEVVELLEKSGFPIDLPVPGNDKGSPQTASRNESAPEWMKLYAAKTSLRIFEAAWILHGVEPPTSTPKTYIVKNERMMRSMSILTDLVAAGDIATKDSQWHIDGEPDTWLLDHGSVLEWCRQAGYDWPLEPFMRNEQRRAIPAPQAEETTSSIDEEEINALKKRIEDLEGKVRELQGSLEDLSSKLPLHPGHLMGMAIDVQNEYWQSTGDPRPKADVIIQELKARNPDLSDAQARAIEKVACPIDRK